MTGSGERAARDFLAETFFTDFDKQRKSQQSEAGSKALEKHDVKKRLRTLLKASQFPEVLDYLKSLSPSGVELEILSLTTFEFGQESEGANFYVSSKILIYI